MSLPMGWTAGIVEIRELLLELTRQEA